MGNNRVFFSENVSCHAYLSLGLVWEMEESSGLKRIEGDFEKF
jgi:hypothetical protein